MINGMRFAILTAAAALAAVVSSCAPSPTSPVAPTTLVVSKDVYTAMSNTDTTRTWATRLSCGCPFPMGVEGGDTSVIHYSFPYFDSIEYVQYIYVTVPKVPTTPGVYTGWLAITTIPPINETLRDTLRDTIVVH